MSDGRKGTKVPASEDIQVIDIQLKESFILVVGMMVLTGLGYGIYTHIRASAEQKRIESIGNTVAAVAREVAGVVKDSGVLLAPSEGVGESLTKGMEVIPAPTQQKKKAS